MQEFSSVLEQLEDSEAILEYVCAESMSRGARWFSYHCTPIFTSQTSRQAFVWAKGFPAEIQRLYISEDYLSDDPLPAIVFEHGPVLTWQQARALSPDTAASRKFFAKMDVVDSRDGASFALYGPRNRESYAAIGFVDPLTSYPDGHLSLLHSMLQAAHFRICRIIDAKEPTVVLSDREREVLAWIGRGKTAADIATILDLSIETIRTYIKRVYDKLQASDRVTATVRALQLGLIAV